MSRIGAPQHNAVGLHPKQKLQSCNNKLEKAVVIIMHNYVKAQRVPYYIYSLRGGRQLRANAASASPDTHSHTHTHATLPPTRTHTLARTLPAQGCFPIVNDTRSGLPDNSFVFTC